MKEETIYTLHSLYRDDFRITGYSFGEGEKAACIIGATRGNEVQQLYIASQLVKRFGKMEEEGRLKNGKILVIPAVNPYSLNLDIRFWPGDHSDINRMFPGYDKGETTQRIAAGLFEAIKDYPFGIQFASFYMPGTFMPHIRIMDAGYEENVEIARQFGMPYIVVRQPRPYETTTLNYNWQIWGCHAFSLYTTTTTSIDKNSTQDAIRAVLRFLAHQGILSYSGHEGYQSRIIADRALVSVRTHSSGFFETKVRTGYEVLKDSLLAKVVSPVTGELLEELRAPMDGIVFFMHNIPLVNADTAVIKLIPLED